MPYQVVKDSKGKWRIKDKGKLLPPHYRTKGSAEKVRRFLYARESPNFRDKK